MMQIPEAALDKHVALLGMTGSGKTSVIKAAIVEPDLAADRRVLIITPKDDWWGLRLSKTGNSKGFDIPIFGGWHADYPMQVKDAALLAETYGTMKGSAIFCTSRLSVQDRATWFAAFAEKLLSANRGFVRVVIDEAHVFMPKQGAKGGGSVPLALHVGNELVSQGRSLGLRIVLASQRSAKLHNDSLTQCSCLIAMLLMAPHDRDAVKDWIEDQADPQKGKEIIASLATLKTGQAWVWAPVVRFLERIQFPRPSTFDSSAAPAEDAGEGHKLAQINLDALKGKLATIEAERKASDPKELKAAIATLQAEKAKLERQMADAVKAKVVADPEALKKAEQRGFEQAQKKLTRAMRRELAKKLKEGLASMRKHAVEAINHIDDELREIDASEAALDIGFTTTVPAVAPVPRAVTAPRPVAAVRTHSPSGNGASNSQLGKGEKTILIAVAQYPNGASREQLTALTGYKRSSRDTYLQRLGAAGYVTTAPGGLLIATQEGVDALGGDYEPLPVGKDLQAYWLNRLGEGERKILSHLIDYYPESIERDALDDATGYKRSSRDTYLQRLGARMLVTAERGTVKAADILFGS